MDFLFNQDILTNILYYLDIKDVEMLLKINKNSIIEHYRICGIHFTIMPIFVPCYDIVLYLKHYHSYISGTDFPEEPLWLFRNKEDGKFNEKYQKLDNIR